MSMTSHESRSSSFRIGESVQEKGIGESGQENGLPYVPECCKIPSSHRASSSPEIAKVPVVDLAGLRQGP